MENVLLISTILATHILAWLTPGPIFVLIVRNSLVYSRKAGMWTALGLALGNFIHIAYSIAAATLLISISDVALIVLKFLGVAYLVYLGLKTILTNPTESTATSAPKQEIAAFAAFRIGFLANLLNPNASLFFASIFATLISSGVPFWVVGFLWVAMPLNSLIMASILSFLFTQEQVMSIYRNYESATNKLLGAVLLFLAATIALR